MTPEQQAICALCGEPMPEGEEMFYYHGMSGDCPKPPLKREPTSTEVFLMDNAPCLDKSERTRIIKFIDSLLTRQKEESYAQGKRDERERINQYFADKASYDVETDETIISEKTYHRAFNPEGCGSNECEICLTALSGKEIISGE
jgi:hypothetical protein